MAFKTQITKFYHYFKNHYLFSVFITFIDLRFKMYFFLYFDVYFSTFKGYWQSYKMVGRNLLVAFYRGKADVPRI